MQLRVNGVGEERNVTTSIKVAALFKLEHSKVLEDIKHLDCDENFRKSNIESAFFETEHAKDLPMYFLTIDGFALLVTQFYADKTEATGSIYQLFDDTKV